jgi:hypothetical protein
MCGIAGIIGRVANPNRNALRRIRGDDLLSLYQVAYALFLPRFPTAAFGGAMADALTRARFVDLHYSHGSAEGMGARNHLVVERNESCSDALGDRDIDRIGRPQSKVEAP